MTLFSFIGMFHGTTITLRSIPHIHSTFTFTRSHIPQNIVSQLHVMELNDVMQVQLQLIRVS